MGKYYCSLKEKITYSNVGSSLIGVGVPLTVLPILIATGIFSKDTLRGKFSGFTNGGLKSIPTATYFAISVLGTVSTIVGITLDSLYLTANTTDN
jgi:hypothetical protein